MKRYIKSETSFTSDDYKAALLLLKQSHDEKQITRAQEIVREFKAKNPELAEKIKAEVAAPRPKAKPTKSKYSKYRW